MWGVDEIKSYLKDNLKPSRYGHTLGVVKTAIEQNCQIICVSALLTTTMSNMEAVVKCADEAGIREKVKIMIGGAPVTDAFAKQIGADAYTPDAATCADVAANFCA